MKKNLLTLLVAASLVVSMVACGGNNDAANNDTVNTEVSTEAVVETEAVIETETVVETEVEAAADVPVFACDWICTITFNADGTFVFDLADYQITEEGTWTMDAEGVITVTKPSGNTCVSYIGEDGLVHLDYVADASEQLVGQFYIAE